MVGAPTVGSKRKLANISLCECEACNPTPAGNQNKSHDPVTLSRVVASVVQSYSQGSDDDPCKEYHSIDGRIDAVLENTELFPGLVRREEELLSSITADDDDDEILPEVVDAFASFTERATETIQTR